MPPPDSHAIDQAILALLRADPTLAGYAPDGIYFGSASTGSQRFVLISIVTAFDEPQFGGRAWDDLVYAIDAVMLPLSGNRNDADEAAARINQLLDDQVLAASGFAYMTMHRISRIALDERDESNPSIVVYHRGGNYRVQMTPIQ